MSRIERFDKISGVCFSIGSPVAMDIARRALALVAQDALAIRTYSFEPYHAEALRQGLKVVPGCWIGNDPVINRACMDALIAGTNRFKPALVIVGHEVLMRGDLTARGLVECIEYVRARVPKGTKITTGEEATYLANAPSVIAACDVIGIQYYPFQYGVHIDRAVADFARMYMITTLLARGKQVIVLETGWPTHDGGIGDAVASLENAERYFRELMAWARKDGVEIYWFEAFNELFKKALEAPHAWSWGLRCHETLQRKYWLHERVATQG